MGPSPQSPCSPDLGVPGVCLLFGLCVTSCCNWTLVAVCARMGGIAPQADGLWGPAVTAVVEELLCRNWCYRAGFALAVLWCLWVCPLTVLFVEAAGRCSSSVQSGHWVCQPRGLLRGPSPQAKFSCCLWSDWGHLAQAIKQSTDVFSCAVITIVCSVTREMTLVTVLCVFVVAVLFCFLNVNWSTE